MNALCVVAIAAVGACVCGLVCEPGTHNHIVSCECRWGFLHMCQEVACCAGTDKVLVHTNWTLMCCGWL